MRTLQDLRWDIGRAFDRGIKENQGLKKNAPHLSATAVGT